MTDDESGPVKGMNYHDLTTNDIERWDRWRAVRGHRSINTAENCGTDITPQSKLVRPVRERDIEKYLTKRCADRKWVCYKFASMGARGMPDRIVVVPPVGWVIFVELKAPGRKPTRLQEVCHENLRKAGATVHVLDSYEQVNEFVRTVDAHLEILTNPF